ncbi:hypothetical protein HDA40_006055 [Hamadaea flava]|uniref:Uncharacterized protein n=1 Tax=Hamadaea flava TaxID=1742688 RepID=A0ABV8LWG0_9ACTN|nr:hypothetical protein [Hamadaea flava]MCP2327548.1 hypothetical protein [Hamadaea flava]
MSRTDKDAPAWLGREREPRHTPECLSGRGECALPDAPPRHRQFGKYAECRWLPAPWRPDHPPAWFVRDYWTSRQRLTVRLTLLEAVKEHRDGGPVDAEPAPSQHRHGAAWVWN